MAESNPTQVILTDDGIKIIEAQSTADAAAGNINDINSDNKLTPSEKIKLKQEYDKDVELYNIDIEQLKSVNLPTAELETAMSNLTNFVTPLFKEMNITSTIDRNALNSVFTAFATADKNASQAFVNMVQQVADDAKKAGDDAKEAGEQAQEAGEEAKTAADQAQVDATQAKADATTAQQKAQSSIDQLNAHLPDIDEALNTANLVKQNVTKLSNTTEQYHNEYTTGVQNVIKTIDDASTEIDQLNNAIKLKADSSDVTSQINVATKGIQSEVDNKVSDLNTKVSQTDSAWRASISTLGTTNMVYNGGFAHGVDGWNTENGKWTWSNKAQDQVQGNNAIQASFTGLTTDAWNNAASRPFLVCPGQKMSIGAIVTPWVLDSDPKKGFGVNIEFFASKDGTGARNSYHPDQWVYTTGRQQLKVENITVPDGVNSAVVRLFIQRNGGANFTRVQANMTPTLPQFIDGFATATDITASINDINLKVSNSDGSSSQVNMNSNTILLDANKIILSGNTSIQDGTIGTAKIAKAAIDTAQIADGAINNAKIANAAIDDAKISNLNGNKIIAGSITANKINVDDLIANGINTKTLTSVNINTPNLNLGDNGQIIGDYSVNDDTGWFQPINGSGTLQISHGYIRSTANILYYNKILNGIGGDKWGHWASSTQFVPAPDQAHPDAGNIAESTFTPAFLKLDIFSADKSKVNSRTYVDGTGLYINDGGTQAVSAMLSDYELLSSGMAYLNGGIQMKQGASFTFGNLAMNGYHSISMLDGNALNFTDNPHAGGNPIEIIAKTFTKSSRLSIKHDITPLSTAESSRLLNAIDVEKFRYTHDGATNKYQYGGVIDDVNSLGSKQYSMPPELLSEDGTGINLDSLTGILVKRVQDQDKTIAGLSMRLTKLEMEK